MFRFTFKTVYTRCNTAVKRQFIPDLWSTNRKKVVVGCRYWRLISILGHAPIRNRLLKSHQQLWPWTWYGHAPPKSRYNNRTACRLLHYNVLRLRHVRRECALLSFHSVCLCVCLSVIPRPCRPKLQPTTIDLIDHNQIWSAGILYTPVLGPV